MREEEAESREEVSKKIIGVPDSAIFRLSASLLSVDSIFI